MDLINRQENMIHKPWKSKYNKIKVYNTKLAIS